MTTVELYNTHFETTNLTWKMAFVEVFIVNDCFYRLLNLKTVIFKVAFHKFLREKLTLFYKISVNMYSLRQKSMDGYYYGM